jgi:hypothetical protein
MSKKTIGDIINSKKNVSSKSSDKEFNLDELDEYLGGQSSNWKPDRYLSVNKALEDALNVNSLIKMGETTIILGFSNTGKSQFLCRAAIKAQEENIMPIFIITELKFSMKHLIDCGFEAEIIDTVDEDTGELSIKYKAVDGKPFLYRDDFPSIESIAEFMNKCLKAQKEGKLKYDILFLLDTFGNVECQRAIDSNTGNAMWNASSVNTNFHKSVCKNINLTRKTGTPYLAGFVCLNHSWVNNHIGSWNAMPTLDIAGGNGMWKSAYCVVQFGDTTKAGTSHVRAVKQGKNVDFATRVKVTLRKFHDDGVPTNKNSILIVKDGFIADNKESIKEYSKLHSKSWLKTLNLEDSNDGKEFLIVDEENEDDE